MRSGLGILSIASIVATIPSFVFPAQAKSLEEELSFLVSQHPLIEAARKDLESADEGVNAAFADFLPDVSVIADSGYEFTNSPARRNSGQSSLSAHRKRGSVELREKIFDGFGRESNFEVSKINRNIAEIGLDGTVQDILLEGAQAYHEVLRQRRLVDLAKGSEEAIRTQLRLEDERVRRGSGIEVDVLFSKTRLQVAKEERVAFEGTLRDARARYIDVFGRPADEPNMIEPVPPIALLPESVEDAIAIAQGENPEVLSGQKTADAADEQRDVARSEFFPRIDFVAQANVEDDFEGTEGFRNDFSFLVELTWDIFSGFETKARVAQAAADYSASVSRLNFTNREVTEEASLAFNELVTARERVDLLQNAVNIAEEVFAARKRLREAGRETAINVLDAETELFRSQIRFTIASYDARLAAYRVLAAIGRLTPESLALPAPAD